jgi:hypothetical protein
MKRLYFVLTVFMLMGLVLADSSVLIKHNSVSNKYIDSLHFLEYDNEHNPITNANCSATTYSAINNAVVQIDMPSKKLQSITLSNDYYNTLAYDLYTDGEYYIEIVCYYGSEEDRNTLQFTIQTKNELDSSQIVSSTNPISLSNIKNYLGFIGITVPPQLEEIVNNIVAFALSIGEEDIMPIIGATSVFGLLITISLLPLTLIGMGLGVLAIPVSILALISPLIPVAIILYEMYVLMVSFSEYNGLEKIKSFMYYQVVPIVIGWNLFVMIVVICKDTVLFFFDVVAFFLGKIPILNMR